MTFFPIYKIHIHNDALYRFEVDWGSRVKYVPKYTL